MELIISLHYNYNTIQSKKLFLKFALPASNYQTAFHVSIMALPCRDENGDVATSSHSCLHLIDSLKSFVQLHPFGNFLQLSLLVPIILIMDALSPFPHLQFYTLSFFLNIKNCNGLSFHFIHLLWIDIVMICVHFVHLTWI